MTKELKDIQKHYAMQLVSEVHTQLAAGLITEQEAWDKVVIVVVQVHENTNTVIPPSYRQKLINEQR
jgi:hypothetical protein